MHPQASKFSFLNRVNNLNLEFCQMNISPRARRSRNRVYSVEIYRESAQYLTLLYLLCLQDLLTTLSTILRGSIYEKLRWAFKLYDLNGDGCITRSELEKIVSSVHELMGKKCHVSWNTGEDGGEKKKFAVSCYFNSSYSPKTIRLCRRVKCNFIPFFRLCHFFPSTHM